MSIASMAAEAARNVYSRMGDLARDEMSRRNAQPCVHAEFLRLRLASCKPIMRPWFRWRRRVWVAKCKATAYGNTCRED